MANDAFHEVAGLHAQDLPSAVPPIISGRMEPPSPPPRSRIWVWATLILGGLLILTLVPYAGRVLSTALSPAVGIGNHAGPRMEEVVLKSSSSRNKILMIPLEGIIMGNSIIDGSGYSLVDLIREQLRWAAADDDVKAILLKVDSPGGEVLASDEIYKAIMRFQKEHRKPVIASMGSVAASGGYYVSAPCQWIVANEMTITGSIGVIMSAFNYRGLMDKVGLRPEVFKSGNYKDMLRGSKSLEEISDAERQMVQDLVDQTFQRFKEVVAEGRRFSADQNRKLGMTGQTLSADWREFADGRIFSGKDAFRLGFVDELGDFQAATLRAKKIAQVEEASLVQYQQVFDLSTVLRLFGEASPKSQVRLDLGIDLPKLKAGQLYFLSPTLVH